MNRPYFEIAERVKNLREIMEISEEEMANITSITLEKYRSYESGESDFSFTFLHKCADRFGVDIVELLTGIDPKLNSYSVTRAGKGISLKRREGFVYDYQGSMFKGKRAEPFVVKAPYIEEEQNKPIHLSTHKGQEFDYVMSGSLLCNINGHIETLNAGDSIYYDSGNPHGMIATGGKDCIFLAVVIKVD